MNELSQTILTVAYTSSLIGAVLAIMIRLGMRRGQQAPPSPPSGRVQVWFYRRGDLICAVMLFLLFTGLFALTLLVPNVNASQISALDLILGVGFQLVITLGLIAFALRNTHPNQWLGLRWKGWPWVFVIAPATVGAMWVLMLVMHVLGYVDWMESLGAEPEQDAVTLLKTTKDPVILMLMIFTAVIIAPLWEEVVFRGYLHPVLKKYGGVWTGAIFSSLLFAAVHNSMAAMLPLFVLAMLMVWLYERTGSIWTPIAIHACFNAAAVVGTIAARTHGDLQAIIPAWLLL